MSLSYSLRVSRRLLVVGFHNRIVSSVLPLANIVPSGEYASAVTRSECALIAVRCSFVPTFQSRILLSVPPLAKVAPSGEKATAVTSPVCPSCVTTPQAICSSRVARCCPVVTDHSLMALSLLPLANILLSGENASEVMSPA